MEFYLLGNWATGRPSLGDQNTWCLRYGRSILNMFNNVTAFELPGDSHWPVISRSRM